MTDTPEHQCSDAVEVQRISDDKKAAQRREANKLRKRKQRAEERAAREQISRHQAAKLAKEAEAEDQERIRRERIRLIVSELTPPIQPPPDNDPDYWPIILEEVELYLIDRFGAKPDFDKMYERLSICREGKLILNYYGVEPLSEPPKGWSYILGKTLQLFKQPHGPSVDLWEGLTEAELEARAIEWAKRSTPSPVVQQAYSQELLDLYRQRIADKAEEVRAEIVQKKKAYADRIRLLELLWKTGRATKAKSGNVSL